MSIAAAVVLSTPRPAAAVAAYELVLGAGWRVNGEDHWQVGSTRLVVRDGPTAARLFVTAADLVGSGPSSSFDAATTLLARRCIDVAPAPPIAGAAASAAPDLPVGVVNGAAVAGPRSVAERGAAEGADIARLDHVVMSGRDRDALLALFGAGLGFDLRLEQRFTLPRSGEEVHQLFLRGAGTVVEVLVSPQAPAAALWGLAWASNDPDATHARLAAAGVELSEIRDGHKRGTRVFTIRGDDLVVPTIVIGG